MRELIAITYPNRDAAEAAAERVRDGMVDASIELQDLVIAVRKQNGKVSLKQSVHPSANAAIEGGALGLLVGLFFLMPGIGLVTGAAVGAVSGALSDHGISDAYMKGLSQHMQAGEATLFLLLTKPLGEKALEHFRSSGGTVLHTSLSDLDEARLQTVLNEVKAQVH